MAFSSRTKKAKMVYPGILKEESKISHFFPSTATPKITESNKTIRIYLSDISKAISKKDRSPSPHPV